MCKKAEKNDYAQFMNFEVVTLVPFEREAIIPELLGETELKWLNEYHKHVYEAVEPLLENKEEKEWLKEATAEDKIKFKSNIEIKRENDYVDESRLKRKRKTLLP